MVSEEAITLLETPCMISPKPQFPLQYKSSAFDNDNYYVHPCLEHYEPFMVMEKDKSQTLLQLSIEAEVLGSK
jgi:hypothetical protein